ncbi:MAG: glycoside hydrolase family 25 protein [Eggerthellaceae bacterium]|nr:glycoside hydrolase family 25 protein [Eggerthellaceae bacterium]
MLVSIALSLMVASVCALSGCKSKWDNLSYENGRFMYVVDGKQQFLTGIDVSDHNHYIDWRNVSLDGIDFAFVRAGNRGYTEGWLYEDERFEENYTRAKANGLFVGVYIFSQAVSEEEAIEEADFVLGLLHGRSLDLPIVFDWESIADAQARTDDVSPSTLTSCALAFCKRIEAAGYQPMIYTNLKDSSRYEISRLDAYPVWFAQYGVSEPQASFDITMWQYTSSGSVYGVEEDVDLDILFLDADKPILSGIG